MCEYTSFEKEEAFKKEILLFLLKKQDDNTFYKHIEQISPLKLEHYSNSDYVSYLLNFQTKSFMLNELEYILETEKFDKERYEKISQIDEIV